MMPSILAQRDRVFFLLAPVVYMLHMRGWRLADFQRVFIAAALFTVADYAVAYPTIDAEAWYSSGDFYKRSMVTYDELRGYRLKGSLFIAVLVALYFGRRALQARNLFPFGLRSAVTAVSVTLLVVTFSRSTLMAVIFALALYGLFLWRAEQVRPWHIIASTLVPITILVLYDRVVGAFSAAFAQDWSYEVRLDEVESAWKGFLEYPLLGFGQGSYYSVSLQELFPAKFHPSDIGVLGVALEFGVVGILLYLFFGFWIFVNFFKLLVAYRGGIEPGQRAFLWVLFIMCFTFIIVSPLQQPFLGRGEEVGVIAFCWGLLLAYKHGLPGGLHGNKAAIQVPPPLYGRAKSVANPGGVITRYGKQR